MNDAFLDSIMNEIINNQTTQDTLTWSATSPLVIQDNSAQLEDLLIPMMDNNYNSYDSFSCIKLVIILILIYLIYKCLQSNNVNSLHKNDVSSTEKTSSPPVYHKQTYEPAGYNLEYY